MDFSNLPAEVDVMRNATLSCLIVVFSLLMLEPVGSTAENFEDESRHIEVTELLELSGSYKLELQSMRQIMNAVHENFNRKNPEKKISDEIWAKMVEDSMGELDKAGYYSMMVPIYEKYLTKEDVRQITVFYKSNVGRKFISVMPDIMKDGVTSGQEWSKKAVQRIIPKIEKRLREMGYPGRSLG